MRLSANRIRCGLPVLFLAGWSCMAASAGAQFRTEAYLGTPFGVGRVELELPPQLVPEVLGPAGVKVAETGGHVFYPVVADRPVLAFLRNVLERPQRAQVYFLFQGDGPLELTVQTQSPRTITVSPRISPAAYDRLLSDWWREYTRTSRARLLVKEPDYPPMIESYLESMLAPRLGLELPQRPRDRSWQAQVGEQLGLTLGTETIRVAIERERMRGRRSPSEPADVPVEECATAGLPSSEAAGAPQDTAGQTSSGAQPAGQASSGTQAELLPEALEAVPESSPEIEIDPIAMHVPAECYYVRFGSYANFLWVQDTLDLWGGDAQNLIASRGVDYQVASTIEDTLVIHQTELARLLGDTVIADVAIVGTDLFLQEGGAFGLMFHARRNNSLLAANIRQERLERTQKNDGTTDCKVTLAGREVSLLSSPDGSARSFYAADGEFHFVTTSETLARRFLEVSGGEGSLGATKEFHNARRLMPLNRGDTVFFYLSDGFLWNLTSPQYRVEMVRRMQALADIELVQMAVLAAAAEDKPGDTIDHLIHGGFLPPGFGPRSDGSYTVLKDGEVYDSLRGRRGNLVPIPDVPVTKVTRSEAEDYRQFVDFCHSRWGRFDPILAGIKRHEVAGDRLRIVADLRLSPFAMQHFDTLKQYFGAPDKLRLAPIPEDMVAFETVSPTERSFAGLQDFRPPLEVMGDTVALVGRLRDTLVGYYGTTGDPRLLSLLDPRLAGLAGAVGLSPAQIGLWQQPWNGFTVSSFQPDVLASVLPRLRFEEAERPAQLRVRVEDLSSGRFAAMANNVAYARTRQSCVGNIRLMESLNQQLHVPGDHCKEAAELLLGVKLVCPLGGRFDYVQTPGGVGYWTSTALAEGSASVAGSGGALFTARAPEGYLAPPMNWFRGLDMDVLLEPDTLVAHAEIVMQKPAATRGGGTME